MQPTIPTEAEKTWGGESFIPERFDPREAEPWLPAIWAKYMDYKIVRFQPKENINTKEALQYIKAVMATKEVPMWRRIAVGGYMCSLWFEGFTILPESD